MINLVPNSEKKLMIKDFYYRLVIVFLFMLGFVMLVATMSILPAYFLSSANIDGASKKLEMEKASDGNSASEDTLFAIRALDRKLSVLEKAEQSKFLVSERVINEILLNRMPDVKITRISFEVIEGEGNKISIRGTASSRERLLLFRKALEEDPLFSKVDLPISNFVKGSNIQFYLSLSPS